MGELAAPGVDQADVDRTWASARVGKVRPFGAGQANDISAFGVTLLMADFARATINTNKMTASSPIISGIAAASSQAWWAGLNGDKIAPKIENILDKPLTTLQGDLLKKMWSTNKPHITSEIIVGPINRRFMVRRLLYERRTRRASSTAAANAMAWQIARRILALFKTKVTNN
jgi:hypothetical protein